MQSPVHGEGAWRGCTVPGGDFCPQMGVFLWTQKTNAAPAAVAAGESTVPVSAVSGRWWW